MYSAGLSTDFSTTDSLKTDWQITDFRVFPFLNLWQLIVAILTMLMLWIVQISTRFVIVAISERYFERSAEPLPILRPLAYSDDNSVELTRLGLTYTSRPIGQNYDNAEDSVDLTAVESFWRKHIWLYLFTIMFASSITMAMHDWWWGIHRLSIWGYLDKARVAMDPNNAKACD